jgi:uncharacterized protein (TIGR02421 family)
VLVLELWSAPDSRDTAATELTAPPQFRILASSHRTATRTLDALEKALLAEKWPGGQARIALDYVDQVAPAGLEPLLEDHDLQREGSTLLGLELTPVYRHAEDLAVYPEVLRSIRRQLGHALRQAFFTFSHTRATYRPAHYQELGARVMTRVVHAADRAITAVSARYELLLHVTPVNSSAAWAEFQASRYQRAPKFHYRPLRVDPSELKAALYNVPVDEIEDPALHDLFASKRDEMDRQITMLGDRERPQFVLESLQIYGRAERDLLQTAASLLERLPAQSEEKPQAIIDAGEFAAAAREELALYREQDAEFGAGVEVSDQIPGIMVSRGQLLIGSDTTVSTARVEATLHHEIGTHVLTYHNGATQLFQQLHAGLAGYEELQEGLAVFSEYLVGGLSHARLRVLAGRVIAAETVADGADFVETFRSLSDDHAFAPATAYSIAMRVHRSGGFTKDVIYLRGLMRLLVHLAGGGDYSELLVGKISFEQLEVIHELRLRKILEPPRVSPRYLADAAAQTRLKAAAEGLTVLDLVA